MQRLTEQFRAAGLALLTFLAGLLVPLTSLADDCALVVGVNDCPAFRLPNGGRARPLKGAEFDADRMAQTLMKRFGFPREHITVLKGKAATLAGVTAAFEQVQQRLRPTDRFVFYYAGHGTQIDDVKPFDEQADGLDEALCLFDATEKGAGLLRDDQLGLLLDDLPAQRVTVLLDCCHSGTGIKDGDDEFIPRSLPIATSRQKKQKTDEPWVDLQGSTKSIERHVTVFYACQPEQQAYERRVRIEGQFVRAGQFTHYLLEALNAPDADISSQQLLESVTARLDAEFNSLRTTPIDQQRPVLQSGDSLSPLFN